MQLSQRAYYLLLKIQAFLSLDRIIRVLLLTACILYIWFAGCRFFVFGQEPPKVPMQHYEVKCSSEASDHSTSLRTEELGKDADGHRLTRSIAGPSVTYVAVRCLIKLEGKIVWDDSDNDGKGRELPLAQPSTEESRRKAQDRFLHVWFTKGLPGLEKEYLGKRGKK